MSHRNVITGRRRSLLALVKRPVSVETRTPDSPPAVRLLGVTLHAITEHECVRHIMNELSARRGGWVVTHNLDHLKRLSSDRSFAALCEGATLRVADGMPLVWACALQGTPLPGRVAGSDLIWSITEAAASEARSVFLLGGNPGTAEGAASALSARYSGLRIAGTACPRVGFEHTTDGFSTLARRVRFAEPDIVFVALGSPKQELTIHRLAHELPHTWWIGVGISLSFLAGEIKRAPAWMRHTGMEWTHRLVQEPRRLARRYLVDGIPFAARLLASSMLHRGQTLGHR